MNKDIIKKIHLVGRLLGFGMMIFGMGMPDRNMGHALMMAGALTVLIVPMVRWFFVRCPSCGSRITEIIHPIKNEPENCSKCGSELDL